MLEALPVPEQFACAQLQYEGRRQEQAEHAAVDHRLRDEEQEGQRGDEGAVHLADAHEQREPRMLEPAVHAEAGGQRQK
jgi:hypothetical protein